MLSIVLAAALAAQPSIDSLYSCTTIEDDSSRLACYDALLGRHRGAVAKAPPAAQDKAVHAESGTPPAAAATEHAVADEKDFGLSAEQRERRDAAAGKPPKPDQIRARVVSSRVTRSGRQVVTLDNGQQWIEVEPSRYPPFREGDEIRIRKAALGSFLASGPHSGTGIRIHRLN